MLIHLIRLRGSDSVLCQSDSEPPFPDKKIIDKLQGKKIFFEHSLTDLLRSLKPSYDYIRELVTALDSMDGNMKIESQRLIQMEREAVIVNRVFQRFDEIFKNFPMKAYRKHVRDIRRIIIIDSEKADGIKIATQKLNKEMTELNEIYPKITDALNLSLDIDFNALQQSTRRFTKLVKKVSESKKVSNYEDTMRALKNQEITLTERKASNVDNSLKVEGKLLSESSRRFLSTDSVVSRYSTSSLSSSAEDEATVKRLQMVSSVDQARNSLRDYEAKLSSKSSCPLLSRNSVSTRLSTSSAPSSSASLGDEKGKKEKSKGLFGSKLLKKLTK